MPSEGEQAIIVKSSTALERRNLLMEELAFIFKTGRGEDRGGAVLKKP